MNCKIQNRVDPPVGERPQCLSLVRTYVRNQPRFRKGAFGGISYMPTSALLLTCARTPDSRTFPFVGTLGRFHRDTKSLLAFTLLPKRSTVDSAGAYQQRTTGRLHKNELIPGTWYMIRRFLAAVGEYHTRGKITERRIIYEVYFFFTGTNGNVWEKV